MPTVIGSSQPIQKAEKKSFNKRQEKKQQKREFFVDSKSEETAKEPKEITEE